jgi:ketosteroid isomerase-like protein
MVLGTQFAPSLFASPVGGAYHGIDAVAAYTRSLLEDQTVTMEADEVDAVGDSVVVAVRQHAVGRTSGVPTEIRYFTVWSFRGRKVIRIESFRERAEALEAAGLSE